MADGFVSVYDRDGTFHPIIPGGFQSPINPNPELLALLAALAQQEDTSSGFAPVAGPSSRPNDWQGLQWNNDWQGFQPVNDWQGFEWGEWEGTPQPSGPFSWAPTEAGASTFYGADPSLSGDWMDTASRFMYEFGGDSTGGSGGYGAGGGLSEAQRQAERELERMFLQKQLDLDLQDIMGSYQPYMSKADSEIAAQQGKMAKDAGIYTGLMSNLPTVYKNVGMYTDRHLRQAQRAMMLQDSSARGQIDQSFASAAGRGRAMVLSTSAHNPEAAEALGQGLDEIAAYIGRGMASDQAGWDMVLMASHQLAEAAATAAIASGAGALWRDREQAITAYQNTIDDMMRERRRLEESRDHALQQVKDEAAFALERMEAEWALSDAARAAAGGGAGGVGGMSAEQLRVIIGNADRYTLDAMRQGTISNYVDGVREAWAGSNPLTRGEADMLANILMEAGERGFGDMASYEQWLNARGATATGNEANYFADQLDFLENHRHLDSDIGVGIATSLDIERQYEAEVAKPTTIWGITAAAMELVAPYAGENPDDMLEAYARYITESGAYIPSYVRLAAERDFGSEAEWLSQLAAADYSSLLPQPAASGVMPQTSVDVDRIMSGSIFRGV